MTERALLQTGKMFHDLDGSIVHLRSILNDICVWTASSPTCDGAYGGATHADNFRRRFAPVPEVRAVSEVAVGDPWTAGGAIAEHQPAVSA